MFKNADIVHTQLYQVFIVFSVKCNPGLTSLLSDYWKFISPFCAMNGLAHLFPSSFFFSLLLWESGC